MPSKQEIAYHEAGHAVAHFAFDIPFDKISIAREDNSLGHVSHPTVTDPDYWEIDEDEKNLLIDKHMMICFAGGLAQQSLTGSYDAEGAKQDLSDAYDYASRRCGSGDEIEAYLKWLYIRARNLVDHPIRKEQIRTLATALLEQEYIDYSEAIGIIKNAGNVFVPISDSQWKRLAEFERQLREGQFSELASD